MTATVSPSAQAYVLELDTPLLVLSTQQAQDAELEAQLDRYLNLEFREPDTAAALLETIIAKLDQTTPLETYVRAKTYQILAKLYRRDDALEAEAMQQLESLLSLTEQPITANALAEILTLKLQTLLFKSQLNEAYLQAEAVKEQLTLSTNPRVLYWAHGMLGNLARTDGQFEQALVHYSSAMDALQQLNDDRLLLRRSSLNWQTAMVYTELKNWTQARPLLENLIEEVKKHGQDDYLGDIYLALGYVLTMQKDYEAAEQINRQGLDLARARKQPSLALTFMNNQASILIEEQRYAEAKTMLETALAEAEALDDPNTYQIIRLNLGYIRVMQGDTAAGLAQMEAAYAYYEELGVKTELEGHLEWLAKAYRAAGDYLKLADTLQKQMALREEIFSESREKRINDLQSRYDMKSQAQRITILQQQNDLQEELIKNKQLQQQITLLFVMLMGIAAVLLVKLYRKVRRSNLRLKEMNKQLEYQSLRDPLTGLYNRRAMQEKMAKRHQETQPGRCSLLLLDIDFFKHINDHYGHAAGDAVLIEISKRLQVLCLDSELLIRWGGEEFLIVLQRPQQADIDQLCQTLLQKVSELPVMFEGKEIPVTISGGFINLPFAGVPEHQFNWERVLQVADMALYLSKVNGRNQINLVTDLNVPFADAEPHLQSDLSGAIRENMIQYHTING
jgi:diguanylate cyclase (GGDEF)-like protein